MARSKMWFATRQYGAWVPCPAVGMPSSKVGWANEMEYINGGAFSRTSTAAHKEYRLTWDVISRDDARVILDFADRLYGNGPFFWTDPFTADQNVLPQWFASPFQGLDDGIILNGSTTRGVSVATSDNMLGYPISSIRYTVASDTPERVWIPVPPGYTAWVGAHGLDGTGGTVEVIPTTGPNSVDSATTLTLLDVTDSTRFNASFANSSGYTGIYVTLGGSGTVTLSGIMVQILKDGKTPEEGGFISGQGNSGCAFSGGQPEWTPYSAAMDRGSIVAEMVEVGGWQ